MKKNKDDKRLWKDIPKEEQLTLPEPLLALENYNRLMLKIDETLKIIYQGNKIINKHYDLNLDKETIWEGIFNEMSFRDIMKIDESFLIKLVHEFAKNKKSLWLKPIVQEEHIQNAQIPLMQIAYICFYEKEQVTRKNGNEIATRYGHASGEKLFQNYTKISNRSYRIGLETALKTKNKIKILEVVISKLSGKAKEAAIKDVKILREALENEA